MAWRKAWSPVLGRRRCVRARARERERERESAGAAARVRSPGFLRKPSKYDCFLLNPKTGPCPYMSLYNPPNKIIELSP